jgi:hypothetical protein
LALFAQLRRGCGGRTQALSPDDLCGRSLVSFEEQICKLSNFEYLFDLNTTSAGSFNDSCALSDYESAELDITDEVMCRDLAIPIAMINEAHFADDRILMAKMIDRIEQTSSASTTAIRANSARNVFGCFLGQIKTDWSFRNAIEG